jgi:hypothetical protein
MARKVMYWNTRMKPNSGEIVCSHCDRLSSIAPPPSRTLTHARSPLRR